MDNGISLIKNASHYHLIGAVSPGGQMKNHIMLAVLSSGAAAFAPATSAIAQDADPSDETGAEEEVVVLGALTDVALDRKDIQRSQANDLGDLFRNVPSVTVGGSLGIAQKIYVRGLEDSLLNITIDGAPERGTLFHHVGRVSIGLRAAHRPLLDRGVLQSL